MINCSPELRTIQGKGQTLVDVSPWSEVYDKSTGSTVYIIDCTEGEVFDSLLARNIQDFSDITFVVTYDSGQIEVVDLFGGTAQIDLTNEGQSSRNKYLR